MATHKIHIPDKQHKWPINFADKIKFIFDEDVNSFEIVDHRDYFDPKSPSGSFGKGDKIGPYKPVVKDQNVTFKYDPDTSRRHREISRSAYHPDRQLRSCNARPLRRVSNQAIRAGSSALPARISPHLLRQFREA